MRVQVALFGSIRETVGKPQLHLELPEGSTAGCVWAELRKSAPTLSRFDRAVALAVNQAFADSATLLKDGDEVALLPPVSGGSGVVQVELPLQTDHARLQREPISTASIVDSIRDGADGALCVFEGTARNNTRGRRTLHLEYEAYPAMAVQEMERLASEALKQFAVREVRIVHRVGRLEIGEASVVIVVGSAHRSAAFDATRWIIDTLKKRVPVWKKEFFEDGAVWADGEPFPPDVPTI
ncbi:MAG TPA: molybdenum cofactor biosynthesis protein MoaE [Candidatus Acidoferrales bacterium]|nr:molybdenum cofactor biosynthesis protein MoaE [Candidatus Acidoferrales bacterium]